MENEEKQGPVQDETFGRKYIAAERQEGRAC